MSAFDREAAAPPTLVLAERSGALPARVARAFAGAEARCLSLDGALSAAARAGTPPLIFVDAEQPPRVLRTLRAHGMVVVCAPDGAYQHARLALREGGDEIIFASTSAEETRLRVDALIRRRNLDAHDPITGLRDRRDLARALPAAIARARDNHASCGLLLADVDSLKALNDRYGHRAGDLALARAGRSLAQALGDADDALAWRYGGDEFVAFFANGANARLASVAEAWRANLAANPLGVDRAIERPLNQHANGLDEGLGGRPLDGLSEGLDREHLGDAAERLGKEPLAGSAEGLDRRPLDRSGESLGATAPVHVTISVGGASARERDDADALLARADAAMYRAKISGRDQVALDTQDAP